jgi:hypothetical protein
VAAVKSCSDAIVGPCALEELEDGERDRVGCEERRDARTGEPQLALVRAQAGQDRRQEAEHPALRARVPIRPGHSHHDECGYDGRRECRRSRGWMACGDEERVGRRVEDQRMRPGEHQVRQGRQLQPRLAHATRCEREHCGLGRERVGEVGAGEEVRDADRGGREPDRPDERRELALRALPQRNRGRPEGGRDHEQREAGVVAARGPEELSRREPGDGDASQDERRRQRCERVVAPRELVGDARGEVDEPEDRGERDRPYIEAVCLDHERGDLRRACDHRTGEKPLPAHAHPDHGRRNCDEGGEADSGRAQAAFGGK